MLIGIIVTFAIIDTNVIRYIYICLKMCCPKKKYIQKKLTLGIRLYPNLLAQDTVHIPWHRR